MRQPDITVAIATMGRPSALARCVGALLDAETLPAEIVIVDQSTDDATERLVRQMASSSAVRVEYVRQAPRGLAASRNAAIAASAQPVVAFTDDDCVPDRGWLTSIVAVLETDPAVDVITGRILPLGPDQPGLHAVSSRASVIPMRFHGRALPWAVGSGANIAASRAWLDRVGGFDERLGAGTPGRSAEDVDLLYRLLEAGATVQYAPEAIIFHERKDQAGWLTTRSSYGYGMGAFCGMRLRKHDSYAAWMLARWCADRASSLARACAKGRWRRLAGELLMLKGAASGLAYGARCEGSQVGCEATLTAECTR
jgi:GT2 family glycosyltransferase